MVRIPDYSRIRVLVLVLLLGAAEIALADPQAGSEAAAPSASPGSAPGPVPKGSFFSTLKQAFNQDLDHEVVRGHFDVGTPPDAHRYYCLVDVKSGKREVNGVAGDLVARPDGMTGIKSGAVSLYSCADAEKQGLLVTSGYVLSADMASKPAPAPAPSARATPSATRAPSAPSAAAVPMTAGAAKAAASADGAQLAAFKKAIRAKYALKEQAFAAHDAETIVTKFYTADAISVGEGEGIYIGRDKIRPLYQDVVKNNLVEVESVYTFVDGNAGWDWADFHVKPTDGKPPFTFAILFLWSKIDGEWMCKGDFFVNGSFRSGKLSPAPAGK